MDPYREGVHAYVGDLARALDECPPYDFAELLLRHLRRVAGATACTILLADYEERTLMPVPGRGEASTTGEQRLDSSQAGRAYQDQEPLVIPAGTCYVGYFPMSMRAERLGVLEVDLPSDDPALRVALTDIARFLGYAPRRGPPLHRPLRADPAPARPRPRRRDPVGTSPGPRLRRGRVRHRGQP